MCGSGFRFRVALCAFIVALLSGTPLFAEAIQLVWDPPPDADLVVQYAVYRDGELVGVTANPYLDSVDIPAGTSASFSIAMYRLVPESGDYVLKITWLTTVTHTSPSPVPELCGDDGYGDGVDNNGDGRIDEGCASVTGVPSVQSSGPITLAWDPPSDPANVLEYRVYGDGRLIGTTTFLELPGIQVTPGTTQNFWVTSYGYALDGSGMLIESQRSGTLTYTAK
jgi:hypothetical protein